MQKSKRSVAATLRAAKELISCNGMHKGSLSYSAHGNTRYCAVGALFKVLSGRPDNELRRCYRDSSVFTKKCFEALGAGLGYVFNLRRNSKKSIEDINDDDNTSEHDILNAFEYAINRSLRRKARGLY